MNLEKIEKIKALVTQSSILNSRERGEWLALLEVMDDKQLFELEKILGSGIRDKGPEISKKSSLILNPSSFAKASTFAEATADKSEDKLSLTKKPAQASKPLPPQNVMPIRATPALSHILNLPKGFSSEKPQSSQAAVPNTIGPLPSSEKIDKQGGFLTRLRDILREKELPAPHAGSPLELAAVKKESGREEPSAKSQVPEIGPGKLARKTPPPVPLPPKPKLLFPMATKQKLPPLPILQHQVEPLSKAPVVIAPSLNRPSSQSSGPPSSPVAVSDAYQPGLKSWSKLADSAVRRKEEGAREQKAFTGREKPLVLKPLSSQEQQPSALREPELRNLENLASLTAAQLKTYNASQFVSKTKALMNDFGYHSVMFNLEKSPLYQAYLETGTQLLKDNSAFEKLTDQSSLGHLGEKRYLTREEFEDFADLLMEIQAS